jgi:hypothetical protein
MAHTRKPARASTPRAIIDLHSRAVVKAVDAETLKAHISLTDTAEIYRAISRELIARAELLESARRA